MTNDRIGTIGLLTAPELASLGSLFDGAWPVDKAPCFSGLLRAIDEADRELWRERDAQRKG
jgi:hypothetical protein